ncbi:TRAP transporter substrate-binding protein [Chloroflexota bacterium]
MMKRFIVVTITVLLIGALILCSCGGQPAPAGTADTSETIELKCAFHLPAPSFPVKGPIKAWAKKIEEESGGRVKITLYPNAALVKMRDEYNAVETGLVDMVVFTPAITPGLFPRCELVMLPKLFPTAEVAGNVFHELIEKYCVDTELKNTKFLWVLTFPPMNLHGTEQVYTLEEFKGKKIRTEGKVESWTVEALGATGLNMDTMEIFTSVERGLIDEFFFLWEGVLVFGFTEITQYRTKCDMFARGFPCVMNRDSWNSLPPDIQEIFTKNSGQAMSTKAGAEFDIANAESMALVADFDKEVGNPAIHTLSEDENARWLEAVSPVIEQWASEGEAEGIPARAMLDDAHDLIAKYSK